MDPNLEITHASLAQQLGAVQATQKAQGRDIAVLKEKVGAIHDTVERGKGAWRVVLAAVGIISTISAAAGAFFARYGHWFSTIPH